MHLILYFLEQQQFQGSHYQGSGLNNPNIKYQRYKYRNVENYECQYHCKVNEGCYYYNYKSSTKECWLKYGMGNLISPFNNGHKKSLNVTENVACQLESTSCNVPCGNGFRNKFIITPPTGNQRCSEELEPCSLGPCDNAG